MRRSLLTLVIAALVAPLVASTAGAATLAAHGWWWRPQSGLLGAAIPPPAVPEDGLAVESLPEEPTAVSAVRYALAKDETQPVLVLTVADQQGDIAIQACATTSFWKSTHGGAWDDRPTFDCGTAVDGTPAEDGKTWRWELAPLLRNRRVDVVLVPAAGAGRVTFEAPDNASLQTQRDTGGSEDFDPPPVTDFTEPGAAPPAGSGGSQGFEPPDTATGSSAGEPPPGMPPADSGAAPGLSPQAAQPPPVAPGAMAGGEPLPQVAGPAESAAAPTAAPPTVPTSSQSSTTVGAIVAAMALLLGLALWHQDSSVARRTAPLARAGIPVAAATVGGLGRFARPRSGAPPPLL